MAIGLSILFFFSLFFSPAHPAEPVKIGLLTSPQAFHSRPANPYLRGAEMAVGEVNAREGKKGVQLLLVLREGLYIQRKDLNELRELIWEERIQFLMGEVLKEAIHGISKLAQEQRMPFLVFPIEFIEAASTGAEPSNLFWISPAPEAFQRAAVRTAAQFPKKRFYLLTRDSGFGRNWAKYFWEELKKLKPEAMPVGEFFLPWKVDDYSPYVQSILSTKAEVCLSHLGVREWLRFAKSAKKLGYFRQIIHFELENGVLESLVALKKDAPEGVWGVSAFPFWALGWKETHEFVAKYRKKTKSYPSLDALSGYVSIYALFEAMKKAGSMHSQRVMGTLEGLTFRTPVGLLAIRPSDHRALWPIWCGSTKFISDYPFAILEDLKAFGPDSFFP
ncbi:MAG: ABC transporter substrate-binding protein [Deltaproteobacteria bacterium]|nr:ABC transporter substrate-binding protein [Deltaproteobacteria bacterium]